MLLPKLREVPRFVPVPVPKGVEPVDPKPEEPNKLVPVFVPPKSPVDLLPELPKKEPPPRVDPVPKTIT